MLEKIRFLYRKYYLNYVLNYKHKYLIIMVCIVTLYVYVIIKGLPSATTTGTVCIFKNITTIPCPGCGTTRGVRYLLHGYFERAFMLNPLSYFTVLISIILPFWMLRDVIRQSPSLLEVLKKKMSNYVIFLIIIITIANWIWNIYKDV